MMNWQVKVILALVAIAVGGWFVYEIRGILTPFVLAFILAYVLYPIIDWMERRGLGRAWSTLLVFSLVFAGLGLGAFKVGDKLAGETVDRVFTIANTGDQPLIIHGMVWEDDSRDQPFVLREEHRWPLEIAPMEELAVLLRFVPNDQAPAANALLIVYSQGQDEHSQRISVHGNGGVVAGGQAGKSGSVVFSRADIGFGEADPNVLVEIGDRILAETSTRAAKIEPMLQPYLGSDFRLAELIREHGERLMRTMLGGTTLFIEGVISGLTFVVIVPFVAFFFLKEGRRLTRCLMALVPNAYFELCLNLMYQANRQIGNYIRGQLLAVLVVSVLAISGLSILGVYYALPLGLLAGLANVIPFLGPLIGIVCSSIVALATGGGLAMVAKVIVMFLVIQLIDNVLIQPTMVAKSVELHPLVVLFVVMVGSQLMGIVGMLIAVPLTGIAKVSGQTIYEGVKQYRLR
ncbi:MAG: AI-2E family transporter [Gemmatimonadetes bacterium]|nr:AI-2E family transporter [Gemmatimonadota bacterium]MYI63819.1 AI-2E family transporter [Gemmatimonadota bacterium]